MKKLIMIMILGLSLIGCTSLNMQTGQTLVGKDQTTTKLTDSNVFFVKDHITLEKYYITSLFLDHSTLLNGSTTIVMSLKYYPNANAAYMLFDEFYSHGSFFIKGILFSDRETVVDLDIKNLSNVIDSQIPNIYLTKPQLEKLYKIMSSSKPITVRVTANDGYFDIPFNENYRTNFKEFLEIPLNLKTYNIPE